MLQLLTCLLVFLGSGDDINFARVVFPAYQAGSGLPLDDPNTDLAESPRESGQSQKQTCQGFSLLATAPASPGIGPVLHALQADRPLQVPESAIPIPLRC